MQRQYIESITFVGLGLIGASLLQAIRRAAAAAGRTIKTIGFDPCFNTLDIEAIQRLCGLDRFEPDPVRLYDADLIVLCAPVITNIALLDDVKRYAPTETLVTDVSSTKAEIALKARSLGLNFIGMHPIAGREQQGYRAASPELLDGRLMIICSDTPPPPAGIASDLCSLLLTAGCKPLFMSPEEHDRVYANISHLPQLISTVLMHHCKEHIRSSGPGFASVSRLAGSPWPVWRDIIETNRNNIVSELECFSARLASLAEVIRNRDLATLESEFREANDLYKLLQERETP